MGDKERKLHEMAYFVSMLLFAQCLAMAQTTKELSDAGVDIRQSGEENSTFLYSQRIQRSFKCIPMLKHFEVELEERLKPGEGVGITGDHVRLGQWQVDKSVELRARSRNPLRWYLNVPLCSAVRIYFRFFIFYTDAYGSKRIRLWEGHQHARVFEAYEMYYNQGVAKFGKAYDLIYGGGVQKEKGWLRGEFIIQLKFIWPQHIRFTAFTHFIRSFIYKIKVTAVEASDTEIEVSRLERRKAFLRSQLNEGELYKPGKVLVFHITSSTRVNNIYTLSISSIEGVILGLVTIPSTLLAASEGILELPIFDAHGSYSVGWLTMPFLKIQPMENAFEFSMRSSFHHYWPQNWPPLDVGHRGVGKSLYSHTFIPMENTIQSFLKAYHGNSDMIELDIHLTKDYVPVVWNDNGFYTAGENIQKSEHSLHFVYIHELTYHELLARRVVVFTKGEMVELTYLNSLYTDKTERIFPTLNTVLNNVPRSLGIIAEIKWPQVLNSGSWEYLQPLDKNRFVDVILIESMRNGCGRPLIFSSFDADICSMIRFKQPVFPTLFLTAGKQKHWESFADLRTLSSLNAIHFAQSADILGTGIFAREVSRAPQHIQFAYELQQVVFVWGDELNSTLIINNYRVLEVAGLIHNHLDENLLGQKPRVAFFQAPDLRRIFLRQCIAIGNVSVVEGALDTHSPFWPRFRNADEL